MLGPRKRPTSCQPGESSRPADGQHDPHVELPESASHARRRDAEVQHRHRPARSHDACELPDRRRRIVDVPEQVRDGQSVERAVGKRQRSRLVPRAARFSRSSPRAATRSRATASISGLRSMPTTEQPCCRTSSSATAPVPVATSSTCRVWPNVEPRDEKPSPARVLAERQQARVAVIGRAERREQLRRNRAPGLGGHGIVRTIFPSCSPRSNRSWAARVSESGKVESTCTRARPLRTSSYAPRKSSRVPIVEP